MNPGYTCTIHEGLNWVLLGTA